MRYFFTCLALLVSSSTSAQTRSPRLDYSSNVEGCMTADRFNDEVSARIGRQGFATESDELVRVRVFADEGEVVAAVEMGGDARVFRDAVCSEVLEAAAAAVAVWIDAAPTNVVGVFGPAALAGTPEPQQPRAAPDDRVRLRVSANREELALHIETNTGVGSSASARFFERLCLLPCETRVPRGLHQFGVARGNGIASPLGELTQVEHDAELFINVRKAHPVNLVGRWFIVASLLLVAPVGITVTGLKRDDWGDGPFWGSIIASSALLVGGVLMVSFSDGGGTEIEVRPF